MATYVNDLRLKEIATGDESGTWGTSTNTNLELIAEAFSFGTEAITTNADTHTTTIADGSTDPGRSIYLKYTGTLDSACTITIGPNTVSKLWFIENGTSGSQNIIISQGSGANVTVPAGEVKAIYSDGAGSGAAMVDAFANLKVSDAAQTNITSLGTLTTLTVDDITINGSTISDSGDLTLDVGGDIVLDAAGQQIFFTSAGTNVGQIDMAGTDLEIKSLVSNADFFIRGNDDGSEITALTLDMSDAGTAIFNNKVGIGTSPSVLFHVSAADGVADNDFVATITNAEATDGRSFGLGINAGSNGSDFALNINTHDAGANLMRLKGSGDCHFPNASAFGIGTDNATHLLELVRSSTDFGPTLEINNTSSANGSTGSIRFVTESESTGLIIGKHSGGHGTADLSFINQELNADLAISTNNTERMRILSGGKVLIGGTASGGNGQVQASTGFDAMDGSFTTSIAIRNYSSASNSGQIMVDPDGNGADSVLYVNVDGVTPSKLKLDSAGRLNIDQVDTRFGTGALNITGEVGASFAAIQFRHNASTVVGSVVTGASSTTYNTSSDYRLKENVDYNWDATTRLKQLKPARFNWISDETNTLVDGFLAHEVQDIVPAAITGEKDAMMDEKYEITPAVVGADGSIVTEAVMGTHSVPDYQNIDHSKLVPLLVKTIQELEARITALES